MRARLEAMIALTEMADCRTRALLAWFGEAMPGPCGHCDNCVTPVGTFDGSVEAQKVLSAVYRTGQRFGALHVVSVLLGKATDMITQRGHDQLPTFGVGADRTGTFWRGVIRQLIALGALEVDMGEFATMRLVQEKARPILRGEQVVMLREDILVEKKQKPKDRPTAALPAADGGLFDALRQWRSAEAKSQRLPPYVIFHDTTLREIAAVRPGTLDEMGQIKGVGASKLSRYGAGVLEVLRGA
jgi:ATP-dependent DNA helicase RecQ